MRYLNKLVLINSASTKFAEVKLDGNVHFIGTQGVGKSTVLRAILFFYNANTFKLGISKEKQHFADYYLPYADSYIVYEVCRGQSTFCVVVTKSQGRVCYRLLEHAFEKEFFIGQDGSVYERWDKIRALIDERGIFCTRKIMKYEEYRDIIYGNLSPRHEFGRFSLLESKLFQNIPRTIQNVFLNSKLEAEFIKETIIDSLNEQDIHINLQTYQYELKGFEDELNDLEQFKKPRILKQADDINSAYIKYKRNKREKIRLASELGSAYYRSVESLPSYEARMQAHQSDLGKNNKKLESIETSFDGKKSKITGQIASNKTFLDTAQIRHEEYQQLGINSIIERVAKKKDLETEQEFLQKEKVLLGSKYKEITQRFDALLAEIRSQSVNYVATKREGVLLVKEQYMADTEALKHNFQQQMDQIEEQNTKKQLDAAERYEAMQLIKSNLLVQRAEVRHRRYYEEELEQVTGTINYYKQQIQEAKNKSQLAKGLQESLQNKWLSEIEGFKHRIEYEIKSEQQGIDSALSKIGDINQKIEASKDSFYGWLNKEVKGWEKNIGQVCDEDLLFRTDLVPRKGNGKDKSFFGIDIDLNELSRPVKTIDDYKAEIHTLDKKIEEHRIAIHTAQKELEEETEKIKKRNNQRIKQLSDELREQEYSLVETERKLQSSQIQLQDYNDRAEEEKRKTLEEIDSELGQATANAENAQRELVKIKASVQRKIKAKKQELNAKLSELRKICNENVEQIQKEIEQQIAKLKKREEELLAEQSGELHKEGADISRLDEIASRMGVIRNELKFIEQNRDKVSDYKKDKRELFDKLDVFQNTKRLLEQQLRQEEVKFQTQKVQLEKESARIGKEMASSEKLVESVRRDIKEMEQFRDAEWFAEVAPIIEGVDKSLRTANSCRDLIQQLRETHYTIIDVTNTLSEQATKFLSHFSDENIFNFNTKLSSPAEYVVFAEELSDFIEDNRIAEYEKRVNERYAEIIHLIGSETNDITSKQGEILQVVTKINQDFTEKNFAGVIKKIELRLGDTSNKVVQVLKLIKNFNDTHSVELGSPNLFSQHNSSMQNKKAVELLRKLVAEIRRQKKDHISLADSFELQFRVVENDNDTGWVERLVNVGSEGTDVLVKAMINIMLLNVFKEGASKRFKAFKLHCMMDEIGRLHPANVRGILQFANDRNIMLINGSPTEHDAMAYKHIYKLEKDAQSITKVKRILSLN